MSPDRQRTPGPSSALAKPYSRQTTPDTPPNKSSTNTAQLEDAHTSVITSKPGFPSYAQYKQAEASYLASLTPNRREKALISQDLFDRIWAVLHAPDIITFEDPNFRFWVRKKFTFGKLRKTGSGTTTTVVANDESDDKDVETDTGDSEAPEPDQVVLLHEKTLVATQEQIYEILCYSHGITGHAGRDKTCQSVSQHYTWIPKQLVARFIRVCPTCIAKKFGVPKEGGKISAKALLPALRKYIRNLSGNDSSSECTSPVTEGVESVSTTAATTRSGTPVDQSEPVTASEPVAAVDIRLNRVANHSAPESSALRSLPMTREVSLFRGLPNGWQFRHDDFSAAHDEFILNRSSPQAPIPSVRAHVRPRIPSIVPMVRAFSEPPLATAGSFQPLQPVAEFDPNYKALASRSPGPPEASQKGAQKDTNPLQTTNSSTSSTSITPITTSTQLDSFSPSDTPTLPLPTASFIKRSAAPISIDFCALDSQTKIQAFLSPDDTASLTPDSPLLATCPMETARSVSPPYTVPPTPTDLLGGRMGLGLVLGEKVARDFVDKAGSLISSMSSDMVCDHGASGPVIVV